jgi:integrase
MPKLQNVTPKYRLHRASGQAVVTLNTKVHYLGPWKSKASRIEYDRLVGEWLAAGRCLPVTTNGTTIHELCSAYLRFAEKYYQKNGKPTRTIERIKMAVRHMCELYGSSPAADFGPLALQSLQLRFVGQGKGRKYVNYLTAEIKRLFKWGVSRELVPAMVFHALSSVSGLRKGRTDARESEPVKPVENDIVDATLPFLPPVVADMVRLHRLTGCRPGEICQMRPMDVDRSGEVWAYRPESHKTEHHGRERVIFIGPQGQAILQPYLLRAADAYCFVPSESEKKRRELQNARRKTPLCCGNVPGSNRVRRRKRKLADRYDNCSYAHAVRMACDAADRKAHKDQQDADPKVRLAPRWSPNQLRHSVATAVRKKFGLEAVQVVLGHASADVTQIYAERDYQLAARVMEKIG